MHGKGTEASGLMHRGQALLSGSSVKVGGKFELDFLAREVSVREDSRATVPTIPSRTFYVTQFLQCSLLYILSKMWGGGGGGGGGRTSAPSVPNEMISFWSAAHIQGIIYCACAGELWKESLVCLCVCAKDVLMKPRRCKYVIVVFCWIQFSVHGNPCPLHGNLEARAIK